MAKKKIYRHTRGKKKGQFASRVSVNKSKASPGKSRIHSEMVEVTKVKIDSLEDLEEYEDYDSDDLEEYEFHGHGDYKKSKGRR